MPGQVVNYTEILKKYWIICVKQQTDNKTLVIKYTIVKTKKNNNQ